VGRLINSRLSGSFDSAPGFRFGKQTESEATEVRIQEANRNIQIGSTR